MRKQEFLKNIKLEPTFWIEFFFFLIMVILAFIFREKPYRISPLQLEALKKEIKTSNETQQANVKAGKEFPSEPQKVSNATYAFLKKRNPFSPEGSYLDKKVPDNPFTLVAVKVFPEKEAILRFFTGELIKVKEGSTLPEGSKVVKINPNSVILKRLNKERELKIFQVEVEKWKPKRPFGSL